MRRLFGIAFCLLAAGCDVPEPTSAPTSSEPLPTVKRTGRAQTLADFRAVVARVEPVAERICRNSTAEGNCDFLIQIDNRSELGANAYQTYDSSGRPVLAFTPALLAEMRNRDEVAFALSHEAAHHIRGHISQTQTSAQTGAVLGAILGTAAGLDTSAVDIATNIGGTVGARRFSKGFELEADSLGAQIAEAAGYDALRGVLYFQDARDPGNQFLGTHPPNADRIRIVRQTVGG